MTDTVKIDSAQAAAALEHPQTRRIVLELTANERSLQELAVSTGLSLSLLHYHVGRLQSLGLVSIVRLERRRGRSVKRYRAAARRFFVPARLATDRAGAALARELRAGLERDRARRAGGGVSYFVDAAGVHRMSRARGAVKHGAFETWIALALTPEDARRLGAEIRALFARYAEQRDAAPAVIAYCAFAERA